MGWTSMKTELKMNPGSKVFIVVGMCVQIASMTNSFWNRPDERKKDEGNDLVVLMALNVIPFAISMVTCTCFCIEKVIFWITTILYL